MKFHLRKFEPRTEIESLEDEVDNSEYIDVDPYFVYVRKMDKYPVLSREEQGKLAKVMYEKLQEVAKVVFDKTDFSSKYFRMVFNNSKGLESFIELMPERRYTYTRRYLADIAVEAVGKSNLKEIKNGNKDLIKHLSKARHDRKSLKVIYEDLMYAKDKIKSCKNEDSKVNMLGFKSLDDMDNFLNKIRLNLESYETIFKRFTEHNLRLVVKIANKYYTSAIIDKVDLIQEGNLGLMRAIEKFDYRKGYSFSSYAMWWINQSILRSILEKSRFIKLPVYLNERIKKIQNIANKFYQIHYREPNPEEIAELTGLGVKKIADIIESSKVLFSLNEKIEDSEEGTEFIDVINDPYEKSPEEETSGGILNEKISKILEYNLTPKEEKILRMRYVDECTLEEIGSNFGFSRERVRQIETKVLKKIRGVLELNELRVS